LSTRTSGDKDVAMTHFELIDIEHAEIIDDFPSEIDAFRRLGAMASEFGWSTFDDLSLVRVDDRERSLIAAEGDLAELVRRKSSGASPARRAS